MALVLPWWLFAMGFPVWGQDGSGAIVPRPGGPIGVPDDHGDTLQEATSLPLGSMLLGRIAETEDKDYFRVKIDEAAEVALFGRSNKGPGILIGRLLDEAGIELDESKRSSSEFLIQRQVTPGTYYVEVSTPDTIDDYLIAAFAETEVDMPDASLRSIVGGWIHGPPEEPITAIQLAQLSDVYSTRDDSPVADLTGLQFAFGLRSLSLYGGGGPLPAFRPETGCYTLNVWETTTRT
ncbi:MAG: hypothetical protein OXP28_01820 [Gammaproteobacteria bacterium]|nr:hypothetical protein [Gammaproteobacteria bacterium]